MLDDPTMHLIVIPSSTMKDADRQKSLLWLKENIEPVTGAIDLYNNDSLNRCVNQLIAENPGSNSRAKAVQSLPYLLQLELLTPKDIFSHLKTALTTVSELDQKMAEELIDLLCILPAHTASQINRDVQVSREEAGMLAHQTLELKIKNSPIHNTSEDTIIKLIQSLEALGYRQAGALLEALTVQAGSISVKEAAKKALSSLANCVRHLHDNTKPDLVSLNSERCNQLRALIFDPDLNENEKVQAIFNSAKAVSFHDNEDPLLAVLIDLLAHDSEKVRLAACYAITRANSRDQTFNFPDQVIQELANLGVNGKRQALSIEACCVLEEIAEKFPKKENQINSARHSANLTYLKRFKMR